MIYRIIIHGRELIVEGPEREGFYQYALDKWEAYYKADRSMATKVQRESAKWIEGAPKAPEFDPTRTDGREARRMQREYEAAMAKYKSEHPEPPHRLPADHPQFLRDYIEPDGYKRVTIKTVYVPDDDNDEYWVWEWGD